MFGKLKEKLKSWIGKYPEKPKKETKKLSVKPKALPSDEELKEAASKINKIVIDPKQDPTKLLSGKGLETIVLSETKEEKPIKKGSQF